MTRPNVALTLKGGLSAGFPDLAPDAGPVKATLAGDRALAAVMPERAADLIRRGGTEDAERLVNELEAALLPRAVAGDVSIGFHAEIPAGEYPADSRLVQLYHPYYSVMFTNEGRFPFLFDCREARANVDFALNLTEVERMSLLSSIYVNERHGGVDVGRFPLGAFTGDGAVDFRRVYEKARVYELELRPLYDLRLTAPLRVAFMLGGYRQ